MQCAQRIDCPVDAIASGDGSLRFQPQASHQVRTRSWTGTFVPQASQSRQSSAAPFMDAFANCVWSCPHYAY